jgi:hypothetical protein
MEPWVGRRGGDLMLWIMDSPGRGIVKVQTVMFKVQE